MKAVCTNHPTLRLCVLKYSISRCHCAPQAWVASQALSVPILASSETCSTPSAEADVTARENSTRHRESDERGGINVRFCSCQANTTGFDIGNFSRYATEDMPCLVFEARNPAFPEEPQKSMRMVAFETIGNAKYREPHLKACNFQKRAERFRDPSV